MNDERILDETVPDSPSGACGTKGAFPSPQILPGTQGTDEFQNAREAPSRAKENDPLPKLAFASRGLQIVRTFAPDEDAQLRALRLLSDAPAPNPPEAE